MHEKDITVGEATVPWSEELRCWVGLGSVRRMNGESASIPKCIHGRETAQEYARALDSAMRRLGRK